MSGPWRNVTRVDGYFEGRGGLLGPGPSRRTRWWELTLDCGHKVERTVRYRSRNPPYVRQRGGTQHRSADAVLPAPKRAQCEMCYAAELREMRGQA